MNTLKLEPGMTVAERYALISVLGTGGMAVVFEARDQIIERRVALKVLHKIEATARFEREARAASALHHPAVVKVFGIGTLPTGHPYIALEFIEGETLIEGINRMGRLAPERALALMMPVVGALAEAHAAGIVHRDIKPSNLILQRAAGQFESLRLLDFGIALMDEGHSERITQTGEIFGTPEFMAPEQAVGKVVGPPADVWALGAVLYELLAGQPPFTGAHAPGILYKVVNEPMPPLPDDVPPELTSLVEECLSKDPVHRPATANVLLEKMEGLLQRPAPSLISSGAAKAVPPPLPARSITVPPPKMARRTGSLSLLWIIAITAMTVMGALGIWATMFRPRPPSPTPQAAEPHLTARALIAARDAAAAVPSAAPATAVLSAAPVSAAVSAAPASAVPSAAPASGVPSAAPASAVPSVAPASAVPSAAPASAVPSAAPASAVPSAAPASAVSRPSPLAAAQAHIEADEFREALGWLKAHPDAGDEIARAKIEALGRIGLNDMGRTSAILRRIVRQDATAMDGAFLDAVIAAVGTQRYWRSLMPALSHTRVRSRSRPRLTAISRTGSRRARRRAKVILDSMQASKPRPKPKSDYEARQSRKLIAQLAQGGDCPRRKRLVIALGKLGQRAAIRPIERQREVVGFSNLCMQGAIDEALKAIRKAQR